MSSIRPEQLFVPQREPAKTRLGRWFLFGNRLDEPTQRIAAQPWYRVLWLTGIDYFSTLAYQPGIALLAAGALSPIATVSIVALTILGALPVYLLVAPRSFAGQGSMALLEHAFESWRGKLLVLALLGFACTGFVITITISAADAARHATMNPLLSRWASGHQQAVTILLIAPLVLAFLGGFRRAVSWAMAVAIPYVLLNVVVLARCFVEVFEHPNLVDRWQSAVASTGDATAIFVATALVFPKLALGLSGFETSLSIMPQVKGLPDDHLSAPPKGRVRATRKLLVTAALFMSAALLGSSFVAAVLVPPESYRVGGPAAGRTLAYLAHKLLGTGFGTVYDLATMAILWFAGASAIVGMLNLVPRYLPRFGMAPHWLSYRRPLVLVIVSVAVLVSVLFEGNVEQQAPVYTTAVLGLIFAGAFAVVLALLRQCRECEGGAPWFLRFRLFYMIATTFVFAYALGDTIWDTPEGFVVVLAFPLGILILGAVSRAWRSTELRVSDLTFTDVESAELWKSMVGKKVHAAPLRTSSRKARREKTEEIKKYYWVDGPIAFLHVNLVDNRSDFLAPLTVSVKKEDENYVVEVHGSVAIANTIAYISELIDPISLFLGLTQQNLVTQSLKYIIWGEGETGLMVYMILLRYWKWTTEEEDVRPNIFLMSA